MPRVEINEFITEGVTLDEDKLHASLNCKCGNPIRVNGWELTRCSCGRAYHLTGDWRVVMREKAPAQKVQDMRVTVKVRKE